MSCRIRAAWCRAAIMSIGILALAPDRADAQTPRLAPRAYDVENFDVATLEESARTRTPVTLWYFGKAHRLLLEPSTVRSRSYREAAGSLGALRTVYTTPARTFKGKLVDDPTSIVRLTSTERGLRGLVKSAEGWVFFEPVASNPANAVESGDPVAHKVFTEGDIDANYLGLCAEPVLLDASPGPTSAAAPPPDEPTTGAADLRVLQLAVDADVEFFQAHGANSTNEIESTVNMVSGIYEAELGITVELSSVNVWEAEPDPYTSSDANTLLSEERSHWNTNNDAVTRDTVHLFTGKDLTGSTVGIAFLSVACDASVAYGLSQDLDSDVLMPLLVAHEMGHNLGASHDSTDSVPRYIMYPSLGLSTVDEFSAPSKTAISTYVAGTSCLTMQNGGTTTPPPGSGGGTGGGGGHGGGPVDPITLAMAAGVMALELWGHRTRCKT